jgi:hypothetical protein
MSKAVLALAFIFPLVCMMPASKAEYFSNWRGENAVDAQKASAQAFVAMSELMIGLSKLELQNDAEAKVRFDAAIATLIEAAKQFQALAEKNANLVLESRFPDAAAQLTQTMGVDASSVATVGDVFALTHLALVTTAEVLGNFANDPTSDQYTAVRKSIDRMLRAGDLSSKLLQQ